MTITLAPPPPTAASEATAIRAAGGARWLLRGVIVLLLLTGAYVAAGHWRGQRQWGELQRAAASIQAEFDALPGARPPLWGEARAGTAWSHYERAMAALAKVDSAQLASQCRTAGAQLAGRPDPETKQPPPAAATTLADHSAALEQLRAGAHASDGKRQVTWSAGFSHAMTSLLAARNVSNLAVLDAITAAQRGDGESAVHRLLDAAQFARDLMASPLLIEQMIGAAKVVIATREAHEKSDLLRRLDRAALDGFARGLERLDASLPLDARWLESEATLFANIDLTAPRAGDDPFAGLALRAWRYGFSARLVLAEHGLQQLAVGARVRALCAERRSVDIAELQSLWRELATSPNPISQMCTPNLTAAWQTRTDALAAVRLMRMACDHARGTAVVALPDPAGGDLRWEVDATGTASFWSLAEPKRSRIVLPR